MMRMVVTQEDFGDLPQGAADKLEAAGVKTVEHLLWLASCGQGVATMSKLSQDIEDLDAILDRLTNRYSATPRTADEIFLDYNINTCMLSTGCAGLDQLLGGGIFTDEVTEIVGPSSSGKTQICLSTAVTLTKDGKATVAYIDSSMSLSPDRIHEIYQKTDGRDPMSCSVLNRVRQYQAYDVETLFEQLGEIEMNLDAVADARSQDEFYLGLRLVVVDAIGSIFAAAIGASGMVGHAQLITALHAMQRIATQHHVAFILCNHTTGKRNATGDSEQAALGQTWPFLPSVSISLSMVDPSLFEATIRKSNKAPVGNRRKFRVSSKGVE